jgi:hypothetical protein
MNNINNNNNNNNNSNRITNSNSRNNIYNQNDTNYNDEMFDSTYSPNNNTQNNPRATTYNNNINKRADVALLYQNKTQLIDVTFAASNQIDVSKYTLGSAANKGYDTKLRKYEKDFNIHEDPDVKLVILAMETSGVIHEKGRKFLKEIAYLSDTPAKDFGQILQTLSVQVQTARALQIHKSKMLYSVDQKPTFPYRAGDIPPVDPPTITPTSNMQRAVAVRQIPRRPTADEINATIDTDFMIQYSITSRDEHSMSNTNSTIHTNNDGNSSRNHTYDIAEMNSRINTQSNADHTEDQSDNQSSQSSSNCTTFSAHSDDSSSNTAFSANNTWNRESNSRDSSSEISSTKQKAKKTTSARKHATGTVRSEDSHIISSQHSTEDSDHQNDSQSEQENCSTTSNKAKAVGSRRNTASSNRDNTGNKKIVGHSAIKPKNRSEEKHGKKKADQNLIWTTLSKYQNQPAPRQTRRGSSKVDVELELKTQ